MNQAQAFDQAFRPTDDQIDRLTALLSIVQGVNIYETSADLLIDGKVYSVSPNLCRACGSASDEDCVHKAITRAVVGEAIRLDALDYAEH